MATRKKTKKTTKSKEKIHIPALIWEERVMGVKNLPGSTLILNRFPPDKAEEIFGPKGKKELPDKKDAPFPTPEERYLEAKFLDDRGRECIPATYFKRAMFNAATFVKDLDYHTIGGAISIPNVLLPLKFKKVKMRFDLGVANKKKMPIYRPEYFEWSVKIPFSFVPSFLTLKDVVNLMNHAGALVGVGCWRPFKKGGEHGRFEVK